MTYDQTAECINRIRQAQKDAEAIMKVYRIRREALQHMREIFTELHCGEWVQIK